MIKKYKGDNHRIMMKAGLQVFKGKRIEDMTEEECKEARQWLAKNLGKYYVD